VVVVGLVVGLLVVARFGVFFDLFKYLCQTSQYSAVQERGKSTGRLHSIDHRKYQKVVKKLWNAQYDLALMKCSTCASCRLKDHEPKKKSMDDPLWKCTPSRNHRSSSTAIGRRKQFVCPCREPRIVVVFQRIGIALVFDLNIVLLFLFRWWWWRGGSGRFCRGLLC
jgi:hypothetical protein